MSQPMDIPGELQGLRREFRTTHWDLVQLAGQGGSPQSAAALESLCRAYWPPLCAYVRHLGYPEHEAQDLTQGYFARLLEKNCLASLTLGKGRFRSFLIASLKNYLANEWDRAHRLKRGGGYAMVPLAGDQPGQGSTPHPADEPIDPRTPERLFDRQWAEQLVAEALRKLEAEFNRHDQRFDHLKVFLVEDKGAVSYADTAARLRLSEQAVKSAVHRLRQRYRELFRAEVALTVGHPSEIDDEMRHLFAALSD